MPSPVQGPATGLLKRLLFRPFIKHPRLQRIWGRLHTLAVFGMNYGGGGSIATSGETWALEHIVRPRCRGLAAPMVFDVGANVGDYSLLVRRLVPGAAVYAFEPAASVYAELAARVRAEGGRIKPFNFGFSDTPRTVELHSYAVAGQEASPLSSIDLRLPTQVLEMTTRASENVRVDTIDRFCETEDITRIDLLKLDVEGHEMAVLRGAHRMLSERSVAVIQFEFGPANIYSRTYFYDFWSLLADDYDFHRIIPAGIAPVPFYGEHLEVFLTTNYLAVRKRAG